MLSLSKMAITGSSNIHSARNKRWIVAAAFGSLAGSTNAFVSAPRIPTAPSLSNQKVMVTTTHPAHITTIQQHSQQTRLFFSKNTEDDDWSNLKRSAGNLVKKGAEKIKSILPFRKTEEEKRAAMIKKEQKEALNSMFKDLPFPIRMAGKMIAPLLSKVGEEIAEQSRAAQGVLEAARVRLVNDDALRQKLGEPLQVGSPFSQSSSSMSINGKSTTKLQASFQVVGPYGSGVATMSSSNGEIDSLVVNINGMNMSVGARTGNVFGRSSSSRVRSDDVIEAEIIEKK